MAILQVSDNPQAISKSFLADNGSVFAVCPGIVNKIRVGIVCPCSCLDIRRRFNVIIGYAIKGQQSGRIIMTRFVIYSCLITGLSIDYNLR